MIDTDLGIGQDGGGSLNTNGNDAGSSQQGGLDQDGSSGNNVDSSGGINDASEITAGTVVNGGSTNGILRLISLHKYTNA